MYTLLIELDTAGTVRFGTAGERDLSAGWYAYTGTALGPGGFSRIVRHHPVHAGENGARHWHVDYLLGHPDARVVEDVRSPEVEAECRVARALGGERIHGVGASDCKCDTHLVFSSSREPLARSIHREHGD